MRFLPLALLLVATPALAQDLTPAETTKVDSIVSETLARNGVPSASIAIVRDGKIVFAKAYGKQSETIATPRSDAPYQIASTQLPNGSPASPMATRSPSASCSATRRACRIIGRRITASRRWKSRSRRSRSSIAGRRSRSISRQARNGNIRTPALSSPG
jgi:hypothetical protein